MCIAGTVGSAWNFGKIVDDFCQSHDLMISLLKLDPLALDFYVARKCWGLKIKKSCLKSNSPVPQNTG